ncbi:hypothetical protein BD626DRAFT_630395, partial [Schizophyllum amplum]
MSEDDPRLWISGIPRHHYALLLGVLDVVSATRVDRRMYFGCGWAGLVCGASTSWDTGPSPRLTARGAVAYHSPYTSFIGQASRCCGWLSTRAISAVHARLRGTSMAGPKAALSGHLVSLSIFFLVDVLAKTRVRRSGTTPRRPGPSVGGAGRGVRPRPPRRRAAPSQGGLRCVLWWRPGRRAWSQ